MHTFLKLIPLCIHSSVVTATQHTCWTTGLWSTHVKVEGIVLKAAWHCGRDCSVGNDQVGEPGHTPLYVGLLSLWGYVDGEQMFCPFSWEGSLIGDSDGYE